MGKEKTQKIVRSECSDLNSIVSNSVSERLRAAYARFDRKLQWDTGSDLDRRHCEMTRLLMESQLNATRTLGTPCCALDGCSIDPPHSYKTQSLQSLNQRFKKLTQP